MTVLALAAHKLQSVWWTGKGQGQGIIAGEGVYTSLLSLPLWNPIPGFGGV